jgi:hypothetical protein
MNQFVALGYSVFERKPAMDSADSGIGNSGMEAGLSKESSSKQMSKARF